MTGILRHPMSLRHPVVASFSLSLSECIYICNFVCVWVCVCVFVYLYIHDYMYIIFPYLKTIARRHSRFSRYVFLYICMYVCSCIHIYMCVCVCVHRYMCVHIYIYIYMCLYIYKYIPESTSGKAQRVVGIVCLNEAIVEQQMIWRQVTIVDSQCLPCIYAVYRYSYTYNGVYILQCN